MYLLYYDFKRKSNINQVRALQRFRQVFDNVYTNPKVKGEEKKAEELLETLFDHYYDHADELPIEMKHMLDKGEEKERVVCDFIAGMTDNYAVKVYSELAIPKMWSVY